MANIQRLSTFNHDYPKVLLKSYRFSPTDYHLKRQLDTSTGSPNCFYSIKKKPNHHPKNHPPKKTQTKTNPKQAKPNQTPPKKPHNKIIIIFRNKKNPKTQTKTKPTNECSF